MASAYLFTYNTTEQKIVRTEYHDINSVPQDKYDLINSFIYDGKGQFPMISLSDSLDNYITKLKPFLAEKNQEGRT